MKIALKFVSLPDSDPQSESLNWAEGKDGAKIVKSVVCLFRGPAFTSWYPGQGAHHHLELLTQAVHPRPLASPTTILICTHAPVYGHIIKQQQQQQFIFKSSKPMEFGTPPAD